MNNIDDADNLIQHLSSDAAIPDREFRNKLRQRVISKYNGKGLFFNFSFMNVNYKLLSVSFATVLLVAVVGVWGYKNFLPQKNGLDRNIDKNSILAKILESNPSMQGRSKSANSLAMTPSLAKGAGGESQMSADTGFSVMPINSDNNYFHSIYTTEYGNAKSSCNNDSNYYNPEYLKSETFSYSGNDTYSSKSINYDKGGNIVAYYLSTNDASYTYYGGSYALKDIHANDVMLTAKAYEGSTEAIQGVDQIPTSGAVDTSTGSVIPTPEASPTEIIPTVEPTKEPEATPDSNPLEDRIKEMFGEDIEIEIKKEGEKEYYVITSKYDNYCAYPMMGARESLEVGPNESPKEKVVVESWVDPVTFDIFKSVNYLNKKDTANYWYTITYFNEEKKVDFSEVKDKFEFDLKNVEVKEFNSTEFYRDYDEKITKVQKDMLEKEPFAFLAPTSLGLKYTGINVTKAVIDSPDIAAYKDRNFYAPGKYGDDAYKSTNNAIHPEDNMPEAIAILSFGNYVDNTDSKKALSQVVSNVSINVFPKETTNDQILKYISGYDTKDKYTSVKTESIKVKVGNETVDGTYSQIMYNSNNTTDSAESSKMVSPDYVALPTPVIIFDYKDLRYTINAYQYAEGGDVQVKFDYKDFITYKVYDLANDKDRKSVFDMMDKELQKRLDQAKQFSSEAKG